MLPMCSNICCRNPSPSQAPAPSEHLQRFRVRLFQSPRLQHQANAIPRCAIRVHLPARLFDTPPPASIQNPAGPRYLGRCPRAVSTAHDVVNRAPDIPLAWRASWVQNLTPAFPVKHIQAPAVSMGGPFPANGRRRRCKLLVATSRAAPFTTQFNDLSGRRLRRR